MKAFQHAQMALAAHLRDPDGSPQPPGMEMRRLQIYRDLLFNNIESLLANGFPVLASVYQPDRWQALVRGFYREFRCHSPYFTDVAPQFLRWLSTCDSEYLEHDFTVELAQYEWIETAAALDNSLSEVRLERPQELLLDHVVVLAPSCHVQAYRYPVHQISREYLPQLPPVAMTYVLTYRDADEQVRFLLLNALTASLLQSMQHNCDASILHLLQLVADQFGVDCDAAFTSFALEFLNGLLSSTALIGVRTRCPDRSAQ